MNRLVTVGVPVYNGERYVAQTIESILAQTWKEFELIISDNGSTDRTAAICKSFAAEDPRVRYYRSETNRGAAWNHNRVFELASGEYFKWQCHDDLCHPEFLEKCVAVLDREPSVVLCYSRFVRIDENGNQVRGRTHGWDPIASSPVQRSGPPNERFRSLIYRGSCCEEIYGLMRSSVARQTRLIGNYTQSDDNFLAELVLRGEFREVPEALFYYRLHPQQSTKAYLNRVERMVWFDTAAAGRRSVPLWRKFRECLSLIHRVPVGWQERLRCYIHAVGWLWTNRGRLKADFDDAVFVGTIVPFLKRHASWTRPLWHAVKRVAG
jgi:glycosyltransferase involved in cell wall biosynthesis